MGSYEFKVPRSTGNIDVRVEMLEAATRDAYRVTIQLRMASRKALEWIRVFEKLAGFQI